MKQQDNDLNKFFDGYIAEAEGLKQDTNVSNKFNQRLNSFFEEAKAQGFANLGELNKSVASQIALTAEQTENPDLLNFIYTIKTGRDGSSNYGKTVEGQALMQKTRDSIDQSLSRKERERIERLRNKRFEDENAFLTDQGTLLVDLDKENLTDEDRKSLDLRAKTLREEGLALGLISQVDAFDKRLENREMKQRTIGVEDLDTPLGQEIVEAATSGNYSAGDFSRLLLEKGVTLDPSISGNIANVLKSGEFTSVTSMPMYSTRKEGWKLELFNVAKRNLGLEASLTLEEAPKIAPEFFKEYNKQLFEIEQQLQNEFNYIRTLSGSSDPSNWSKDQRDRWNNSLEMIPRRIIDNALPFLESSLTATQVRQSFENLPEDGVLVRYGIPDDRALFELITGDSLSSPSGMTAVELANMTKAFMKGKIDFFTDNTKGFFEFDTWLENNLGKKLGILDDDELYSEANRPLVIQVVTAMQERIKKLAVDMNEKKNNDQQGWKSIADTLSDELDVDVNFTLLMEAARKVPSKRTKGKTLDYDSPYDITEEDLASLIKNIPQIDDEKAVEAAKTITKERVVKGETPSGITSSETFDYGKYTDDPAARKRIDKIREQYKDNPIAVDPILTYEREFKRKDRRK